MRSVIKKLNKNKVNIMLVLLGGIVFCFMGFLNRYPLLNWDSAVYIYPAFQFYLPHDRPIIYGLFARLFSINYTLWTVIVSQGVILSLTLYFYFKYLTSRYKNSYPYVICIFLLVAFSGASFQTSILLPDFFTPILILNFGLLFFVEKMEKWEFVVISLLLMLSIAVHNSHSVIMLAFLLLTTLGMILRKVRTLFPFFNFRRLIYLWGLLIVTYLLSGTVHYMLPRASEHVEGHTFTTGQGAHAFMVAKLNQIGILKDFLNENCENNQYKLCEYKDSIPDDLDFLWASSSPLYKIGGWHKNKEEFTKMSLDILTTPKYLAEYIFKSIESSFVLFFSFDIVELPVIKDSPWADEYLGACYGAHRNQYKESLQNNGYLGPPINNINEKQQMLFYISFLFLILILLSKVPLKYKLICIYFLVALYVNAFICSALSTTDPRYQARVVWLMVIPVFLVFSDKDVIRSVVFKVKKYLS